jgi:poly(3-hydroxybutyrate) depolymerase
MREMVLPDNPITRYEVRLPEDYVTDREGGTPVLLYLHGWGGSERSLPAPVARHAKKNGYIVVTPRGYGDGGRNSWNGFRSARLPECLSRDGYTLADCEAGPNPDLAGADSTCVDFDGSNFNYCYDSCQDEKGACPSWSGEDDYNRNTWNDSFSGDYSCYWTTCLDSVAQIEALLDEIERDYCVDRSMIWVTGCSNGGMFVYELAKDKRTSVRFAGYLPQVGSPHPGFTQNNSLNPNPPKFFMGFWGANDTTVPGEANQTELFGGAVALDTNFNGWLYMTARSITTQWAEMNGLSGDPAYYEAGSYASGLDCHAWQSGEGGAQAEIVECFFQGGHSCPGFGNMPQMMWDFAQRHPNIDITAEECL